jgi:hypothetical protein
MLIRTKFRSMAAVVAAAPLVLIGLSACAPTNDPQVGFMGQRIILSQDHNSAVMLGSFRCVGGGSGATTPVMWVSVKQTSKSYDQRLINGGSSSVAKAWYDSHTPVVCDGSWHIQAFKIDRHPDKGVFSTRTSAWLQFCLTDKNGFLATNDQWVQIS